MDRLPLTEQPVPIPILTPWAQARAQSPNTHLVRYINVAAGVQCFIAIPRTEKTAGADIYDGAVVINPAGPYTPDERAQILARADAAWQRAP